VDINKKTSYGDCALITAACYGSVQVLHALLADPRLDTTVRYDGRTAVGCVRHYKLGDWKEAVALMLQHGCPE